MIRKITFLFLVNILLISNLSFSQTVNPYQDFAVEELKTNKDYSKNFNPGKIDHRILYNCMINVLNAARAQYAFAAPVKGNKEIDSVANMQAVYQAIKNERTEDNEPPYKFIDQRLRKYNLTNAAVEFVTKAKSSQGIEEYSYYDLCIELIKPILRNAKQAKILLDKKYTYVGFGYDSDVNMKSIFASIILGNDRTFNLDRATLYQKETPFSKTKNGLLPYDARICQKCNEDKGLEILSKCIQMKGNDIYFEHDDYKLIRKLIGKAGDAIVLDFVQHSQYRCGDDNFIDNDRVNRGFMTKPIVFEKILSANEIKDKKSTKLSAKIGVIPDGVSSDEYDINVIVIKDKYACRTIFKKTVEYKNAAYEEKQFFLKDETTIPTKGDWLPSPEAGVVEFMIPFTKTKSDYTYPDIEPLIQSLNEPAFTIQKIEIFANTSLDLNSPENVKLQKKRAESIDAAFKRRFPEYRIESTISYADGWELFQKDIVKVPEYSNLATGTKREAMDKLKGKALKDLEPYLANHRFARVVMHVTYKTDGENEQAYVVSKFNKTVGNGDLALAMAIQKYMILQVEKRKYSQKIIKDIEVPVKKECQVFLNNKLYIQSFLEGGVSTKSCYEMSSVLGLNNTYQTANFNKVLCDVSDLTLGSVEEVASRQASIDNLYSYNTIPVEKINNLNLEFQFKVIHFLKSVPATNETATLLNTTYDKIKSVVNPKLETWQNAYKLAAVFAKGEDYAYAIGLMDPFIDSESISDDFVFAYISMSGAREDSFMSGNFAKMVKVGITRDRTRFCNLVRKMSCCIVENKEVKKMVCSSCK